MINIRNETESDYQIVEDIARKAFYNIYVPGCTEHYLVHVMRCHKDFIPELDFVIELDGQVIGNIMYTRAKLVDEAGPKKEILTFGPVWIYYDSPVMAINEEEARRYDDTLEQMKKEHRPSQEEFFIMSHSFVE